MRVFRTRKQLSSGGPKDPIPTQILSPQPRTRTSLNSNSNEEIIRDIQTKEEEKISHVDSGKGSKSPQSTVNGGKNSLISNIIDKKVESEDGEDSVTSSSDENGEENVDEDMSEDHQKQVWVHL